MFIIFVILNIAYGATTCTFTLKDTKTVGSTNGAFDVTFTTPTSTTYLIMTVDTNWDLDTNIQIQSSSFSCSINSNVCTLTTNQIRCNSLLASQSYTLQCLGMNNPTYTNTAKTLQFGNFKLDFYNSGDTNLNDGCTNQKIFGFESGVITQSAISPSTLTINSQSKITLQFKLSNILEQSLSDQLQIDGIGFQSVQNDVGSSGYFATPTVSSTSLTYGLLGSITDVSLIYTIAFKVQAGSSKKQHTISVYTFRSTTDQIKDKMTTFTFTINGGSITINSITAPNKIFGVLTTYSLTLKLTNSISTTNGYITFTQPTNLIFQSGQTCQANDGTTTISTTTCSIVTATSLITVSGFSGLTINSGSTIILQIQFTNPSSASSVTFQNFISYTDSNEVDKSSSSTTVSGFNTGIISSITLTPDSYQVGQLTSISYSFTNINQILTGSTIDLIIPSEIQFDTTLTCTLTINTILKTGACAITYTNTQNSQIILTLSSTIIESSTIIIKVSKIRSPYSFRPTTTNGFSLSIKNNNIQFDKNINFGQLTMNTQSAIYLSTGTRDSNLNGALTNYQLSIQFSTFQPINTKLILQFNPTYKFGSVVGYFDATQVITSTDSLNSKITLTLPAVNANLAKTIQLQNIYNLDSAITSILTGQTIDDTYSISSTTNGNSLTYSITESNDIIVNSMTQDNYQLGEIDSYTFQIKITNILNNGCTIQLKVPTALKILFSDCSTYLSNISGFTISTCQVNSQIITITPATYTSSTTLEFQLKNLIQNPTTFQTNQAFSIETYKSTSIMDSTKTTNNLIFSILCNLPCKTCVSTNKDTCLSCYSSSITTQIYYLNNQCLDTCGLTYYNDANNKCQSCSTNCIKCTSTTCTECIDSTYEIKNNKCSKICLANQFDFKGICTDCDSTCSTCTELSTKCTSCSLSTDLLYQNKCLTKCPTGIFQVGLSCIACTSPCSTCGNGPKECTQCITGYYLKSSSSTCVQDCGTNYYKNGNECTQCISPCNNCQSDKICIDCISKYYLFNNECVSTIPNGYYAQDSLLIKCSDECGNCKSQTECTSCPTNKYLLSNKCLDKCPDTYYNLNFICYQCDQTCQQCQSLTLCTQCPDGQSQLTGKCYLQCPNKYYSDNTQCLTCQQSCATCTNSTSCLTCPISAPYFQNKLCVETCQSNYYIDTTSTCIKCSIECETCDKNGCLTCVTNYKQLNQTCLALCPTGYQDLNNTGKCELVTESEQSTITNLQENKYVPVPFTIGTFIFILSVVVSKIQKPETFIPGAASGLMGLIVVGSWAVLILLELDYILTKIEIYLLEGACGLHILFNLINLCVIKSCTSKDQAFQTWYAARKTNACAYIFLNVLSLASFTTTRFYFSRFFGFRFLKCKLSDIENMSGLNVINGLCALLCCLPALVASALLAYRDQLREQLFISSIDSFIVTALFLIILIWETQKDDNFFEEVNYASVSQSHQVIPEFFQSVRSKQSKRFSFENSFNQKNQEQEEEPSFPKIDESIEYKDGQQSQYSIQPQKSKMIQKNSQFMFKSSEPLEKINNRLQDDIVLQMHSNEASEPLSIGNSQREIEEKNQQKSTLEQQQQQALELQKQLEFEEQVKNEEIKKQQELFKQQEEQRIQEEEKIQKQQEQKRLEEVKRQEELKRQEAFKQKQEQERQVEIQRQEELKKQEEEQKKLAEIKRITEQMEKEEKMKQEQIRIQELKKQQEEEQEKIRLEQEKLQTIDRERIAEQKRIEEEAEKQRKAEELRIQEEERKIQEKKQAEEIKLEQERKIQEEKRVQEQKIQEEKRIQEEQKIQEEKRIQEEQKIQEEKKIQEEQKIQDEKRIQEEKKIEEEKKIQEEKRLAEEAERQKQLEIQRIQEEEKKATIEREEQERLKQEELKKQKELEEIQRAEDIKKLQEEQRLQEQKEQEMLEQIQRSKSTINQENQVRQEEIDDLKMEVDDLDNKQPDKLNNIILADEEEDDVGWNFDDNDEDLEQQNFDKQMMNKQKIMQKEIIKDDKNDQDDDWDVPTSGFMSVHPKSQLRKDQQIDEPINPFQDYMKKSQPIGVDLFKQSKEDSDEDWAANQISPSDFNILNQRFENEKHSITQVGGHKKFSSTGQNFQNNLVKRQTQPQPQYQFDSDNDSIEQQPIFDQLARNQLNSQTKKQNKGLEKIYLQRHQKKPQAQNQIGFQDIQF